MIGTLKTNKQYKPGDKIKSVAGRYKIITSENGKIINETDWRDNLIMKSDGHGVNIIVREMMGDHTYSIEITHAKIGTGTTAPTENDTDLEIPTNIGTSSDPTILRGLQFLAAINIVHFEFFISDGDVPNGVYTEWGLFTGTFGVNETMTARALIEPAHNKGTNQDTTIIHEIQVDN